MIHSKTGFLTLNNHSGKPNRVQQNKNNAVGIEPKTSHFEENTAMSSLILYKFNHLVSKYIQV